MKKVTFVGLGTMGYPMAGHLLNKGFEVTAYNRTFSVAEKWASGYKDRKGHIETNLAEVVSDADVVITCLGDDNDVKGVYGDIFDVLQNVMQKGTILIDHTTTSATVAEYLSSKAEKYDAYFLDAPVSGGQAGAEKGILTVMVGGDEHAYHQAKTVIESYAKTVSHVGKSGDGQRCKMVNQLCVAGVLQGLSEGLALAKKSGFSAELVLDALQHGAGSSWQMVNRAETMMKGEFDFGFAVDWMRKDLGICLDEAEKHGLDLPLAKSVDATYARLQAKGCHRDDTSVLIRQFDDHLLNNKKNKRAGAS